MRESVALERDADDVRDGGEGGRIGAEPVSRTSTPSGAPGRRETHGDWCGPVGTAASRPRRIDEQASRPAEQQGGRIAESGGNRPVELAARLDRSGGGATALREGAQLARLGETAAEHDEQEPERDEGDRGELHVRHRHLVEAERSQEVTADGDDDDREDREAEQGGEQPAIARAVLAPSPYEQPHRRQDDQRAEGRLHVAGELGKVGPGGHGSVSKGGGWGVKAQIGAWNRRPTT